MKLGVIKAIKKEDLQGAGNLPGWLDAFLSALNQFLEPVGVALQGKLTFADNILSTTTYQTFTHGTELVVNPLQSSKVVGIQPVGADSGYLIDAFGMTQKSNGSIGITLRFLNADGSAVTAGQQVKARVIILFG